MHACQPIPRPRPHPRRIHTAQLWRNQTSSRVYPVQRFLRLYQLYRILQVKMPLPRPLIIGWFKQTSVAKSEVPSPSPGPSPGPGPGPGPGPNPSPSPSPGPSPNPSPSPSPSPGPNDELNPKNPKEAVHHSYPRPHPHQHPHPYPQSRPSPSRNLQDPHQLMQPV